MASLLAGSLARAIGKALAKTFLSATLTRGTTEYSCRAIFENYGAFSGPGGALISSDAKILVLASSLDVSPAAGDVIAIPDAPFASDKSFVVLSMKDSQNAVSIDPAGAVWTLTAKVVPLQAQAYATYADLAQTLGSMVSVYRSSGSSPLDPSNLLETTKAIFLDGKSQGFNFNRPATYDDILQNALLNASNLQLGDFIVGAHTYFIASMEPLRPINVVECNRTVTQTRSLSDDDKNADGTPVIRQPSQTGGNLRYWGRQRDAPGTTSPDNETLKSNIPVCMIANAGRATGQVETPSGAPGPSRWRIYLPIATFPKGSVLDRDYFEDEEGNRHLVSAAAWTNMGYRVEAVREEL